MGKIVTFGEIMLRLAPTGNLRFCQNERFQSTFGGAEANVAVSLANFGEEVLYVTKLPDNPIADGAISVLRSFGIDVSKIVRGGNRIGIYFIEKGVSQRSSMCIYDRKGSSLQQAEPSDFDWQSIFNGAEWFHFTGITPALGKNLYEICKSACKTAKRLGVQISCDINYRSKLWTKDDAKEAMTELCKYVDLCIINEEDAMNVFGVQAENTDILSGKISRDSYCKVVEKLKGMFGFKFVAVTLRTSYSASVNDWEAMLYDGSKCYFSRTYRIDPIVDRVGAGDSFGAGLIFALKNQYDFQHAIEFATAASALKHSMEGDFNRVRVSEVEKLVAGDESGRVQR